MIVATSGVVFGLISVTGLLHPVENLILFIVLVVIGAAAIIQQLTQPCLHAFVAGAFTCLAGGLLQLLQWDSYADNNPGAREAIEATGMTLLQYLAVATPVGIVICGGVSSLSAFVGTRLAR